MTDIKNRYGIVDPSGKVMKTWFSDIDIESLSKEVGININFNSTGKTSILISRLESIGFVVMLYGKLSDKTKVPVKELYDEWKFVQNEYY